MADSVIKYEDLIGADDTFDIIFDNIEQLEKKLIDLTKLTQKDLSILNPNDEKGMKKYVEEVGKLDES